MAGSTGTITRRCFITAHSLKHRLKALITSAAVGATLASCDTGARSRDASPVSPPADAPAVALAPAASASAAGEHDEHDCRTAHPFEPPAPPKATSLSAEARGRVTTLRISAHVGSVILRKRDSKWILGGYDDCSVPQDRAERALDNLAALKAVPTDERVTDGRLFELEIVVLAGEEPSLKLAIGDRNERGDLVQLFDGATFRVHGLNRELLSPNPRAWCE